MHRITVACMHSHILCHVAIDHSGMVSVLGGGGGVHVGCKSSVHSLMHDKAFKA